MVHGLSVRLAQARRALVPSVPRDPGTSGLAFAALLVLAAFFRTYRLAEVPPGIHFDEIINSEIAERAAGDGLRLFYLEGWGREGLYHALLAGARLLPLAAHWQLRLPSVVAGLATLVLTYYWVRRAFGSLAAITTVAGLAVAFWSVGLSRAALRATTLPPLAAAAAWLLVSIICHERPAGPHARTERLPQRDPRLLLKSFFLALVLGLALYTYRAARLLPAVYLLFFLYLSFRRRATGSGGRPNLRYLWLSLAGSLVFAAPLLLFLIANPGAEPRLNQVDRPWQELLAGNPGPVLQGALVTAGMFGFRGDPENHYNLAGRPVFEPIGAILFYLGVVIALARWRSPQYAFILIWLAVGLVPGALTEPAPHFVHTVVALPVAFVFQGVIVSTLANRLSAAKREAASAALIVALVAWIAANAFWTYRDYFIRWPAESQVRTFHQSTLYEIARLLDQTGVEGAGAAGQASDQVAICTAFLNETNPFWRTGRQSLPFMLNRQDLAVRWYDCATSQVWLQGGRGGRYFFFDDDWFSGWLPERALAETITYRGGSFRAVELAAAGELDDYLGHLSGPLLRSLPVQFGDSLRFLGYTLDGEVATPGRSLLLTTHWSVLEPLPLDLAIFVHLMGDGPEPLAQGDALALLSDSLRPGDVIFQQHSVTIPGSGPPGPYDLYVGVYSRVGDFPPLPIAGDVEPGESRLLLARLEPSEGS